MNLEALRSKLWLLTGSGRNYPALEVHHKGGHFALSIVDRSHTYTMASPRRSVDVEMYDLIMSSTKLDGDLYMMLMGIGIGITASLTASLS